MADTYNSRVRRVDAGTGVITTVAGNGTSGFSGDGGAAIVAQLTAPYGVSVNGLGNLFIVDAYDCRVRRVDADTGIITTAAGNGAEGYSGDGGAANSAQLALPYGVTVDSLGNLFIADTYNHCVRRVDAATEVITKVAGNGTIGFSGDGGVAHDRSLTEAHPGRSQ